MVMERDRFFYLILTQSMDYFLAHPSIQNFYALKRPLEVPEYAEIRHNMMT